MTTFSRRNETLRALTLSVGIFSAFALAGCGGGGGGGRTTTTTPAPSTSSKGLTRVSTTINWGSRSRAIHAPNSALSAVITIVGANADGKDFTWTINRDTTRLENYSDTQQSSSPARTGEYGVNVRFYSQPNGTGAVVGAATKPVTLTLTSADLGEVSVNGTIASVEVAPRQHVPVGQSLSPTITAKGADGNVIAISEGSAAFSVVAGQDKLSGSGKQLQGASAGVAQVVATVDGKTSTPQNVYVGAASLNLNASGTRGIIPLSLQVAGGATVYRGVTESSPAGTQADWTAQVQVVAPASLADRQFVKWQRDGVDFSTSADLTFSPLDLGPATNLTAVYASQPAPAEGFTPNFDKADFHRWKSFPVKVYFERSTFTAADTEARLRTGFDRWASATGGVATYTVVDDPASADITFKFGALPVAGNLGLTEASWDGTGFLAEAVVTMRPDLQTGSLRPQPLETIAAHEFGHAIGILSAESDSGHSTDDRDTMYPTGNNTVALITSRDLNTFANLYPEYFGGRSASPTRSASGGKAGSVRILE